jgi:outer membrane immunogenic protein
MNKLLISGMALAAMIAGPAMAADMPVKAPPPVPVFSWTGCYIGGQIGYGWGRARATATAGAFNGADKTGEYRVAGELGGGEFGCNYQVGYWVWGVEVDGSWAAKDGQSNLIAPFNPVFVDKLSERWLAMARLRIGYAWDKWMWYITGGGAWGGFDMVEYSSANVANLALEQRKNRGAWVIGFGTEYALAYGWSAKWETLYMDFGKIHDFDGFLCCTPQDTRFTQWVSRFGLNYRFNWGYAPVVAKY